MTSRTLDSCGDTLSNEELMAVMGIKSSKFYVLKQHGCLPASLPGQPARYSKAVVEAWLAAPSVQRQLRRAVA